MANGGKVMAAAAVVLGLFGVGWLLFKKAGAAPGTPGTPESWLAKIENAASQEELEAIRAEFESAYHAKEITYAEYMTLYVAYIRRGYYLDLYLRGGRWIQAASEFWSATAGVTDYNQIYPIYLQIYHEYVGGG